jgi:hypothetical protein
MMGYLRKAELLKVNRLPRFLHQATPEIMSSPPPRHQYGLISQGS